jgi:hypothetical protein
MLPNGLAPATVVPANRLKLSDKPRPVWVNLSSLYMRQIAHRRVNRGTRGSILMATTPKLFKCLMTKGT